MIRYLQFTIERLLLRGVHYRLLAAALIVVLVAMTGGVMVWILDPGFGDFGGAVWWAFLRLTDPGYLGDDVGTVSRTVSTVVTVLGYLLFLGLLIAILTQWMNQWILRVESGISDLRLKDHILILGWNHRTPSIVLELLKSTGRVRRFLDGRDASGLRIVVLAREVDAELRSTLREALDELWDDRKVILRAGNPLQIDSLERVAFQSAGAVILPGADFAIAQPGVSDAETIKSLASISYYKDDGRKQAGGLPHAVAALYNSNRRVIAESAYEGPLSVVDVDRTVARLMSQSVLQPGVWSAYSELLSVNEGNGLYLRRMPEGQPASFGALRGGSGRALLVGFIDSDTRTVRMNPGDDREVHPGDELVFVARDFDDCRIQVGTPPAVDSDAGRMLSHAERKRRILVLGWSRKVPLLIEELLCYEASVECIDVVGISPLEERTAAPEHPKVRQLVLNFLDTDQMAGLAPAGYDNIILLARQRLGDEAVADAATLTAYLSVRRLLEPEGTHTLVEVLEEENEALFDHTSNDVMLSPMVVSYVFSQVALRPELGLLFSGLIQSTGPRISLCEVAPSDAAPVSFAALSSAARADGRLAIGVLAQTLNGGRVLLNPDAGLTWTPAENDRLIVLTPADD